MSEEIKELAELKEKIAECLCNRDNEAGECDMDWVEACSCEDDTGTKDYYLASASQVINLINRYRKPAPSEKIVEEITPILKAWFDKLYRHWNYNESCETIEEVARSIASLLPEMKLDKNEYAEYLEQLHWALMGISRQIKDHSYSRSIRRGDSEFIQNMGEQIMLWSNSAYNKKVSLAADRKE